MSVPAKAERNPLRIEQMTVFDIEPEEVVTLAQSLDISLISLWTTGGIEGARPVTEANKRRVLARLRDLSVKVDTVEIFFLSMEPEQAERCAALAAELGAKAIVAINFEPDEDRAAEQLARLCGLAARYGLLVSLEPIHMGVTRTPTQGLRLIQKAGADNARLTIDLLHVHRSGASMDEITSLPAGLVTSIQICDGPATISEDQFAEEGAHTRLPPGAGAFPVEDFLRAIPSAPIGVEVPMRALREQGVSALERTRLVLDATRAAQARAFS